MKRLAPLLALLLLGTAAFAEEPVELEVRPAADVTLQEFLWTARLVVVFADSDADPRFSEQIALLHAGSDELVDRDVIVITDTDPAARSELREELRPRGFMMVLIGKDGGVKLRKPFPWDVREITRVIDKTPLRQQEVRDRRAAAAEAEAAAAAAAEANAETDPETGTGTGQ